MADNRGPPGADIVNVLIAVNIPDGGIFDTFKDNRVAANGFEGSHRRAHTTRHQFLGSTKNLFGFGGLKTASYHESESAKVFFIVTSLLTALRIRSNCVKFCYLSPDSGSQPGALCDTLLSALQPSQPALRPQSLRQLLSLPPVSGRIYGSSRSPIPRARASVLRNPQ